VDPDGQLDHVERAERTVDGAVLLAVDLGAQGDRPRLDLGPRDTKRDVANYY
jgi:hypothetical protein